MRHLRVALRESPASSPGRSAEDDLRDELQSHIELETAENIRRGMPPEEARRRPRRPEASPRPLKRSATNVDYHGSKA